MNIASAPALPPGGVSTVARNDKAPPPGAQDRTDSAAQAIKTETRSVEQVAQPATGSASASASQQRADAQVSASTQDVPRQTVNEDDASVTDARSDTQKQVEAKAEQDAARAKMAFEMKLDAASETKKREQAVEMAQQGYGEARETMAAPDQPEAVIAA